MYDRPALPELSVALARLLERFDIFSPITGGCSEGLGVV